MLKSIQSKVTKTELISRPLFLVYCTRSFIAICWTGSLLAAGTLSNSVVSRLFLTALYRLLLKDVLHGTT